MKKLKGIGLILTIAFASAVCFGQTETLTNGKIIEMTRAGLSTNLILRKIRTDTPDFDLSTESLVALKKSGVSDEIIDEMFNASERSGKDRKPQTAVRPPSPPSDFGVARTAAPNPVSRIVLSKSEALRNAKTIAIQKSPLHPSRQALEKELLKRKDWQDLDLNIVRLKEDADLYVEIGYVSLSWITHRYVYRVYDRRSGTVITAGETTSWGSLSKNLARGIAKRLGREMNEAKKTT